MLISVFVVFGPGAYFDRRSTACGPWYGQCRPAPAGHPRPRLALGHDLAALGQDEGTRRPSPRPRQVRKRGAAASPAGLRRWRITTAAVLKALQLGFDLPVALGKLIGAPDKVLTLVALRAGWRPTASTTRMVRTACWWDGRYSRLRSQGAVHQHPPSGPSCATFAGSTSVNSTA